jgi:chemotaxis protein MotA
MAYLLGLIVASGAIVFSVAHLHQDISNYFDAVGFAVVAGGTIAVAVMILPWTQTAGIFKAIRSVFFAKKIDFKELNAVCFTTIQSGQSGMHTQVEPRAEAFAYQILHDGIEMMQLGIQAGKIKTILEERIFHWADREQKVASAFRSLAKYPPAFGLIGTVLGLVSLMRAISSGASSTETGVRMAVALVATLYGLVIANLIINPASETMYRSVAEEKKACELALQAILLTAHRANLLEAQELLNSYVAPSDRVSAFGVPEETQGAVA